MKNLFYLGIICLVVFSGCEKDVSVSQPPADPSEGELTIESNPTGATIYINGRNTGKTTPSKLKWLDPDDYRITLRKKYFYTISEIINLSKNQKMEKFYDYFSSDEVYGDMEITSYPIDSAEIIIDGVSTGHFTPHTFKDMVPGKYEITSYKHSHWSNVMFHEVYSNKDASSKLTVLDTTSWVQYNFITSNIKSERVYEVVVDNENKVWLNLWDQGLSCFDGSNFRDVSVEIRELFGATINTMFLDEEKTLWIASSKGIFRKNSSGWSNYNTSNSPLPSNNINDLNYKRGVLLASTENGLAILENSVWKIYDKENTNIATTNIMTADMDDQGRIYVGTSGFGIYYYNGVTWDRYTEAENELLTNYIAEIDIIGNKLYVICDNEPPVYKQPVTNFGGLCVQQGNNFSEVQVPLNAKTIYEIKQINEDLWVSTGNGTYQMDFNNNVKKIFHSDFIAGQLTNSIISVDVDPAGNIWMGCFDKGLVKYKPYNDN